MIENRKVIIMSNSGFKNIIKTCLVRNGYTHLIMIANHFLKVANVFCINNETRIKNVIRINIVTKMSRHYLIASSLSDLGKNLFEEDVEEYYVEKPISWIIEEYIFGACSLRNEIVRRKELCEYHGFINEMSIRFFMICGFFIGIALILYCMLIQSICNLKDNIISKIHINK